MKKWLRYIKLMVALPIAGSAILLNSCSEKNDLTEVDSESLMTIKSDTLVVISSESGNKMWRFSTPLLEGYDYAAEPYKEFRKGIAMESYDSLGNKKSNLTANYAIYLESQQLWEAKGNVVAINDVGRRMETQQLFWNQKTKKVYSNVDWKMTDPSGEVFYGVGFVSDERFEEITSQKFKGKMLVDVSPSDSTATNDIAQPNPVPTGPAPVPATVNQNRNTVPQPRRPHNPYVGAPKPMPVRKAEDPKKSTPALLRNR